MSGESMGKFGCWVSPVMGGGIDGSTGAAFVARNNSAAATIDAVRVNRSITDDVGEVRAGG